MFEAAWRAGEKAWRDGVPREAVRTVASKRARAYAARRKPPTPREWARTVYRYGVGFLDGNRSAGHDQATGDLALAVRLRA